MAVLNLTHDEANLLSVTLLRDELVECLGMLNSPEHGGDDGLWVVDVDKLLAKVAKAADGPPSQEKG